MIKIAHLNLIGDVYLLRDTFDSCYFRSQICLIVHLISFNCFGNNERVHLAGPCEPTNEIRTETEPTKKEKEEI